MSENNQLWPDERIAQAFMVVADDDGQITGGDVMLVIQGMRDEMQEKINHNQARIDENQKRIDRMQQRIDELENSWRNRVEEDWEEEDDWDVEPLESEKEDEHSPLRHD